MNCWHCNRPASGVCVFCGRGVCPKDTKNLPRIITAYRTKSGKMKTLVVENALYCGICNPKEDPVDLEILDLE